MFGLDMELCDVDAIGDVLLNCLSESAPTDAELAGHSLGEALLASLDAPAIGGANADGADGTADAAEAMLEALLAGTADPAPKQRRSHGGYRHGVRGGKSKPVAEIRFVPVGKVPRKALREQEHFDILALAMVAGKKYKVRLY